MKCEVLSKCVLAVNPGSIVNVDERQFETARKFLAPADKQAKAVEVETAKKPRTKKK